MHTNNKYRYILGIESSCDDTSAAVIRDTTILSNVTANQDIHVRYGGVVPELASRAHQQNIVPVVDAALKNAGITKNDLDAVAFTNGPGLLGSLLVGSTFAKSMGQGLNIPIVEVNHMVGHVLAHFLQRQDVVKHSPSFPFICLTVSGGHTQIVLVKDYLDMEVIGETMDDAAGEAFDKAAKLLGLPYPGGPLIDKNAQKGDANAFSFTFPKTKEFSYSFSGLKTQFLYFLQDNTAKSPDFVNDNLADICASYQQHIIAYLFRVLKRAVKEYGIKDIAIAGGVSANSELRETLQSYGNAEGWNTFIPDFEFCTDNAAMIAITGYYKFLNRDFSSLNVAPTARMRI